MAKRLTEAQLMDEASPSPALESARKAVADLEQENKKLKQQVGSDEALFECIRDELEALEPYKRRAVPKGSGKHAEHAAVAIIADTHSDEYVDSAEIEGIAGHEWSDHETRMSLFADKVGEITDIVRQSSEVNTLNVWLLGDFFVGQIHPEENEYSPGLPLPRALPAEGRVLADTILRMGAGFDKVRVVGMVGNHGRTTRKPAFKMRADRNWDTAVYLIAQEIASKADHIEWCFPRSAMHVEDVMGTKNLLTHGDVIQVTHRTPYFAIEDTFFKQRDARRTTDVDFDHVWMGHFHHAFQIRDWIHGCPSMVGDSQYSLYKMHTKSSAAQSLVFFTEKHGPTTEWRISL